MAYENEKGWTDSTGEFFTEDVPEFLGDVGETISDAAPGVAQALGGFATGFASGYTGQDYLSPYLKGLREKNKLNKRTQDQVSIITGRLARDPNAIEYARKSFPGLSDEEIINVIGDYDSVAFNGYMNEWQADQLSRQSNAAVWAELRPTILGNLPALANDPSLPPADAVLSEQDIRHWKGVLAADEAGDKRSADTFEAFSSRLDNGLLGVETARGMPDKENALSVFQTETAGILNDAMGKLTSQDFDKLEARVNLFVQKAESSVLDARDSFNETNLLAGDSSLLPDVVASGPEHSKNFQVLLQKAQPLLSDLRDPITRDLIERSDNAPADLKKLAEIVEANKDVQSWNGLLDSPEFIANPNLINSVLNQSTEGLDVYKKQVRDADTYNNMKNMIGPMNDFFKTNLTEADLIYIPGKGGAEGTYQVKADKIIAQFKTLDETGRRTMLRDYHDNFPQSIKQNLNMIHTESIQYKVEELGIAPLNNDRMKFAQGEFNHIMSGRNSFNMLVRPGAPLGFGIQPLAQPGVADMERGLQEDPRHFLDQPRIRKFDDPLGMPIFPDFMYAKDDPNEITVIYGTSEQDVQGRKALIAAKDDYFASAQLATEMRLPKDYVRAIGQLKTPRQIQNFIKRGALTRTPDELREIVQQSIAPTATLTEMNAQENVLKARIREYEALTPMSKASGYGIALNTQIEQLTKEYGETKVLNDTGGVLAQIETLMTIMVGGEGGAPLDEEQAFVQFKSLIGKAITLPGIEDITALEELPKEYKFLIDEDISYFKKIEELQRLQKLQGFSNPQSVPMEERMKEQFRVAEALIQFKQLALSDAFQDMTANQAGNDLEIFGDMMFQRFGIDIDTDTGYFIFAKDLAPEEARFKALAVALVGSTVHED